MNSFDTLWTRRLSDRTRHNDNEKTCGSCARAGCLVFDGMENVDGSLCFVLLVGESKTQIIPTLVVVIVKCDNFAGTATVVVEI